LTIQDTELRQTVSTHSVLDSSKYCFLKIEKDKLLPVLWIPSNKQLFANRSASQNL